MTNEISDIILKAKPLTGMEATVLTARLIALQNREKRINPAKPLANLEFEYLRQECLIIESKLDEWRKQVNKEEALRTSGFRVIKGGKASK
jgi:hypothetical protein